MYERRLPYFSAVLLSVDCSPLQRAALTGVGVCQATHDVTWEQSPAAQRLPAAAVSRAAALSPAPPQPGVLSPTVNMPSSDTVVIEADRSPPPEQPVSQPPQTTGGSTPSGSNTDVAYSSQ